MFDYNPCLEFMQSLQTNLLKYGNTYWTNYLKILLMGIFQYIGSSTPTANFTNVLREALTHPDRESTKNTVKSSVSFFEKKLSVKCEWNWNLETISTTFYKQIFANNF